MKRILSKLFLLTVTILAFYQVQAQDPLAPGEPTIFINTNDIISVHFDDISLFDAEVMVGPVHLYSNADGGPHSSVLVDDGVLEFETSEQGAFLLQVAFLDNGFPTLIEINIIANNDITPTTNLKTDLPVEFSGFDVVHRKKSVLVTWQTLSEMDADYFAVQRSINGRDFTEVGRVNSAGNSSTKKDYSFEDRNVTDGTYYYRLKQVDLNGQYVFTETKTIRVFEGKSPRSIPITISPNFIKIHLTNEMVGKVEIFIFDIAGKPIYRYIPSSRNDIIELDTSQLPQGKYIASVRFDNQLLSGIFIKYWD